MTNTFDITALVEPLYAIRLALGDTGPDEWLLADEVILAYAPGGVLAEASTILAAARLADLLATRFIAVDVSEGGASASLSQLAPQYAALAKRLRAQAVAGVALSATDTESYGPAFTRAMGDADAPVTYLNNGYFR
jgi:hypothetical protein